MKELRLLIKADGTAQVVGDLRAVREGVQSLGRTTEQVSGRMSSFGSVLKGLGGLFVADQIAQFARASLEAADALVETADALNLDVERYQELQYAATQSGVSVEKFRSGLGYLARQAGESGIEVDRAFKLVVRRMGEATTQTEKHLIAQQAFGRGGQQMVLAFGDGGAAAAEMAGELRAMNGVIQEDTARAAGVAVDKIGGFVNVLTAHMVIAIADYVLPALKDMAEWIGVVGAKSVTVAAEVSLSFQRIGNTIAQWWQQIKLAIPDYMDKDEAAAKLAELQAADRDLQNRQAVNAGVKGAIGEAGVPVIRIGKDRRDLGLEPSDRRFLAGLGRDAGKGGGGGGGGGRRGKSETDEWRKAAEEQLKVELRLEEAGQKVIDRSREEIRLLQYKGRELEIQAELGKLAAESYEEYSDGVREWVGAAYDAKAASERLAEQQSQLEDLANEVGGAFTSAFTDAIIEGNRLSELLEQLARQLLSIVARELVLEPMAQGISSFAKASLTSWLGANVFHSGGVVGEGGSTRWVEPGVFAAARRMHSGGLASDEVPAILRRGEEVLARDNPRHIANDRQTPVVVNLIESPGKGGKVTHSQDAGGRNVIEILVDQIRGAIASDIGAGRGAVPSALERTYGVSRAAGVR